MKDWVTIFKSTLRIKHEILQALALTAMLPPN